MHYQAEYVLLSLIYALHGAHTAHTCNSMADRARGTKWRNVWLCVTGTCIGYGTRTCACAARRFPGLGR